MRSEIKQVRTNFDKWEIDNIITERISSIRCVLDGYDFRGRLEELLFIRDQIYKLSLETRDPMVIYKDKNDDPKPLHGETYGPEDEDK